MLENEDKKKKIIGVQVDDDLNEALINLSAELGVSLSGAIRMVLIDYLRRYKGYKKKEENK